VVDQVLPPEAPAAETYRAAPATGVRKWLAFGTGVGIEVEGSDFKVAAVRVRPSGCRVLAYRRIENVAGRPAGEWGNEYTAFARAAGVAGVPVWLLLPRSEVTVRHLILPGVAEKDLAAAVGYQADGLHPYEEGSAVIAHARLGSSRAVLVGISKREVVDHYSNLLAEAGIRMAGFSFSAAVLYSASRVLVTPPASLLATHESPDGLEVYGESPARPVFSGLFEMAEERARRLAVSELRLESDPPAATFFGLLPPLDAAGDLPAEEAAPALAAAISAACPRLALGANLLPEERRTQTSTWIFVPTIFLGVLLSVLGAALAWQDSYQDHLLVERLQSEIRKLEKEAASAQEIDKAVLSAQDRIALIDRYRKRPLADMEALRDATAIIAPPGWLQGFQLSRTEIYLSGEAENATQLLKAFDQSPRFENSQFSQALSRIGNTSMEIFTVKTSREGDGTGLEAGEPR
jgi:hypothetical protein